MEKVLARNRKKRLGEVLVEEGVITEDQVQDALALQHDGDPNRKFGTVLVDAGMVTEEQIADALAHQLNYERIDISTFKLQDEIKTVLEESVMKEYKVFPFGFNEKNANILRVAMTDPLDIRAIDDVSLITGLQLEIYVCTPKELSVAFDRNFGNTEAMRSAQEFAKEREAAQGKLKDETEKDDGLSQAPIVKLVRQIIEQAARKRTSDIHIEPLEKMVRIRFRVDGVLQEEMKHDISVHAAMIARIKVISGLDIAEKRKPQDGRATAFVDGTEFDIRVSILPTVHGEKVVMRMTQKTALTRDKKDLGLAPDDLVKFENILTHPNGIMLVTGPTGSGKSTTLYTALSELNTEDVNIITVEDPVEADLPGINQVQTNEKAGLTFASALRSILRQDPDIIMIGEIRDEETANIAVKAAITGHLVVSTLHTNSSASTITRLEDMGLENYLIADSVVGVIAQRLVRRICPKCCVEYEPDETELKLLGVADTHQKITIKKAVHGDCPNCNGSGYRGRIGVYEIMPITAKLRLVITSGAAADEIEKEALKEGMKTLRQGAIDYVLQGITTIDEVKRITYED